MFEFSIQKAWDNYHQDMGLGRVAILVALFSAFFFYIGLFMGGARPLALAPLGLSVFYLFFRPKFLKLDPLWQFLLATLPVTVSIKLNYVLVGQFDMMANGLTRRDPFFIQFDQWLFGKPVADVFYHAVSDFPLLASVLYDFMMFSYVIYFLLPIYGAVLYYRLLEPQSRFYLGRYFASVVIFFNLNYLFYLAVPVTGPQFYLETSFQQDLPFSSFGQGLHQFIAQAQSTFIDCFPSGHAGIAILVSIWLFRLNHIQRFIITPISLGIIMATLAMRYHYVLDVVAALPLAVLCYMLSYLLIPLKSHSRHRRQNLSGS